MLTGWLPRQDDGSYVTGDGGRDNGEPLSLGQRPAKFLMRESLAWP